MKKLIILLFALSIFSCVSTKKETSTTFVNTKPDNTGKIYTVLNFEKITNVKVLHARSKTKLELSQDNYKFDDKTSNLIIENVKFNFNYKEAVFTITGIPKSPCEFILSNLNSSKAKPLVCVNGKLLSQSDEYTFDKNKIVILIPFDADEDSYNILWLTNNGLNSMNNNYDNYKSEYQTLEKNWISKIR